MAEPQPKNLQEGASGDVEDEVQNTAKSAEDRKAAAAMASLDTRGDDAGSTNAVDQEAVSKAMKSLGGGPSAGAAKDVKKVKVDPADVALLVDELDLSKQKATELLKAHDGDAVRAMKAFIAT
ncbi:hypothetical protein K445DRAFT_192524 [Daldinia sp. EC12]|nr:hypothetical protein F4774DRAFT_410218 [Daldinia eschscholtzii]OTB19289.1 hypothetical protein K445DRAFT_192524 [Daldinia sp. EC12]